MSCLCLEVYYRYLRIYEREDQLSYGDVILAEYHEETVFEDKQRLLVSLAEYPTSSVKKGFAGILRGGGEDRRLRIRAAELLAQMGGRPDVEKLLALVERGEAGIRGRAMRLLTRVANRELDPSQITPFLASEEAFMRMMAVRILERIGGPTIVEPLISALGDSDKSVATEAAIALRAATGMTLHFDAKAQTGDKDAAIEEWQRWWEEERDAGDFGRVRLIRTRITDVNAGTGQVTLATGRRNRAARGQVFIVEKDVRGEAAVIRLEVVDVGQTTSRAQIGEKSQAFSLAIGDAAVLDASRVEATP